MTEEPAFLIAEIWLDPSKLEEFKAYRIQLLDLLQKFNFEYVYHGHPFAWVLDSNEGSLPTGIEIWRFETEEIAKQALNAVNESGLLSKGNILLNKTRCYPARYGSDQYIF